MVLVNCRHPHHTRHHHIGMFTSFTELIDALARCKFLNLDLCCQYRYLFSIKQRKQRNLSQLFCLTSHRSPRFSLQLFCTVEMHSFPLPMLKTAHRTRTFHKSYGGRGSPYAGWSLAHMAKLLALWILSR